MGCGTTAEYPGPALPREVEIQTAVCGAGESQRRSEAREGLRGRHTLRRLEFGDRTIRSEERNAQVVETRGLEHQAVSAEFVALEEVRVAR